MVRKCLGVKAKSIPSRVRKATSGGHLKRKEEWSKKKGPRNQERRVLSWLQTPHAGAYP